MISIQFPKLAVNDVEVFIGEEIGNLNHKLTRVYTLQSNFVFLSSITKLYYIVKTLLQLRITPRHDKPIQYIPFLISRIETTRKGVKYVQN